MYKFDLHCHTKEGSIDAHIGVVDYARLLKIQGYSGMLVTDHDSYKGYNAWKNLEKKPKELEDFVVLKGIEYDTRNGGHVLVILPDVVDCPLLEKQGLGLRKLAHIVHEMGGVIGAAHPFGYGYFAIMNTRLFRKNPDVLYLFDFIETFNAGVRVYSNLLAKQLAAILRKPETCGSDAHVAEKIGTAYTAFKHPITCNNDLIHVIREREKVRMGARRTPNMYKNRNVIIKNLGIYGYWTYNKLQFVINSLGRTIEIRKMHLRYV